MRGSPEAAADRAGAVRGPPADGDLRGRHGGRQRRRRGADRRLAPRGDPAEPTRRPGPTGSPSPSAAGRRRSPRRAPLPGVTDPVTIDGDDPAGLRRLAADRAQRRGARATSPTASILTAGQSTVRGLVINRFDGNGIVVLGGAATVSPATTSGPTGPARSTSATAPTGSRRQLAGTTPSAGRPRPTATSSRATNPQGIDVHSSAVSGQYRHPGQPDRHRRDRHPGPGQLGGSGILLGSSENIVGGRTPARATRSPSTAGRGAGRLPVQRRPGERDPRQRHLRQRRPGHRPRRRRRHPERPGDGDAGPNRRQNFPTLDAAFPAAGGGTTVQGRLDSRPGSNLTLDFFAGDVPDPSGFGEGRTSLGSTVVMTDDRRPGHLRHRPPDGRRARPVPHRHGHRRRRQHLGVLRGPASSPTRPGPTWA